jgi:hypothetical protein
MLDKGIVRLSGMHLWRSLLSNQFQGRLEGAKIELAILLDLVEEDVNVNRGDRLVEDLGVSSKFGEFGTLYRLY